MQWDIIITFLLILFSLLPLAVFTYVHAGTVNEDSILIAVISVDHVLSFIGILSGIVIGIFANYLLIHVEKLQYFQHLNEFHNYQK